MQSRPTKFTIKVKREHNNDITSSSTTTLPRPVLVSDSKRDPTEQMEALQNDFIPSPKKPETITSSSSSSEEEEDNNNCGTQNENNNNQIVVYSPSRNDGDNDGDNEGIVDANPIGYRAPRLTDGRVLPSVGAFTVQCANCFKWRLIPTKEKYEEIREHILEQPFVCEAAREWRPEIKCEDEADIKQDGSRVWAIDKPNIAQPPPGWQRLLRIRSKESSKFADVYYVAPSGKRLRSMVEIQRYLVEHPEYSEGVSMSQFSFQIPRPLQKDYVKRKSQTDASATAKDAPTDDNSHHHLQLPEPHLVPANVAPLSAVVPPWNPGLQLGGPTGYHPGLYERMGTPPPPAKKVRRNLPNAIHID